MRDDAMTLVGRRTSAFTDLGDVGAPVVLHFHGEKRPDMRNPRHVITGVATAGIAAAALRRRHEGH
jgi:hypothetical protein